MGQIHLVVTLPKIGPFSDPNLKFAWVKRVGFALIKSIEIEINGRSIDKHYGEWLNLWAELTGEINGLHSRSLHAMTGDVPDMTNFTNNKDQYLLFIPLQFWFCRNVGSALPLISLQYCDVKINVEFQDASYCYMMGPSHYIKCRDDIANFMPFEYIEQNINGDIRAGIFLDYDINTKKLYYYKITQNPLTSIPVSSTFDTSNSNLAAINALLSSPAGLIYTITGKSSAYTTFAEFNNFTSVYSTANRININLGQTFLLVDYHFLDDDERIKFAQAKHDYLIEQLFCTPDIPINSGNYNAKIIGEHPCKLIVWVTQLSYVNTSRDYYNYTDSYQNKVFKSDNFDVGIGKPVGKSLITQETILMNGNPRLTLRDSVYFDGIQVLQHTKQSILPGINMYSFGEHPFLLQPTGTCNLSQIDNLQIQMLLQSMINANQTATFRGYCLVYNVLRVVSGLAAPVFTK